MIFAGCFTEFIVQEKKSIVKGMGKTEGILEQIMNFVFFP